MEFEVIVCACVRGWGTEGESNVTEQTNRSKKNCTD